MEREGDDDKRKRVTVRCPPGLAEDMKRTALKHCISENRIYVEAWRYAMKSRGFHMELQANHPRPARYGFVYDSEAIERS